MTSSTQEPQLEKSYDLIAFDMDGTMLNDEKGFSPRAVAAIEKALSAGICVVSNSGRSLAELNPYRDELAHVRYAICQNGSLIADRLTGDILSRKCFDPELATAIVERLEDDDCVIQAFSNGYAHFEAGVIPGLSAYDMAAYIPLFMATSKEVSGLAQQIKDAQLVCEKLDLYWTHSEARNAAHARLAELPIQISLSEETGLEISPLGVDKGSGLSELAALLGIDMSRVVMIGDGDNDIPALEAAGLAVVTANARESAHAVAQLVVSSNNEAGAAEAIEQLMGVVGEL